MATTLNKPIVLQAEYGPLASINLKEEEHRNARTVRVKTFNLNT
tara:strand:+ start:6424 stop:6555 length:132 start_codon:yes stop_codon:yes gene_type:complete